MNRTTKLALAISMALPAIAAHADDTNVTIYGRVVAGVDYETNVLKADGTRGSVLHSATNQWGTSMLGFKGTEDLGGGLKALFLLETGFGTSKGVGNGPEIFNRRTYVGLAGEHFGTLKIGKDVSISNDIWNLDPTGQQWMSTATLVKGRNWPIWNNMISYQTPTVGGFGATFQTSLGEQPGSVGNLRKDAVSLAYNAPSWELRAIYDVQRDANGRYSDLFNTSREFTLGGTMTIDKAKLFGGYQHLSAPDAAAGNPDAANLYWAGVNYQITPALTLIGAAYRVTQNQNAGDASLYVLGANYALSKRTLLYASVGTVRNNGNANFSVELDNTPGAGQTQNGAYFGITHSF